jgi:hypothetical protein
VGIEVPTALTMNITVFGVGCRMAWLMNINTSTLKMEAWDLIETFVPIYKITRRNITEASNFKIYECIITLSQDHYGIDCQGSIPGTGKRCFFTSQCPDRLWN